MMVNGKTHYKYVRIGGWDSGNLTIDEAKISWPALATKSNMPLVESVCSKPCPKGQIKVVFPDEPRTPEGLANLSGHCHHVVIALPFSY